LAISRVFLQRWNLVTQKQFVRKKSTQNFPREIFASHAGMIFKAFGEEKER
jgi:hypothetical protein